jgi:hypothetical protein
MDAPSWVLDCNCSICRRYGALWAYREDILANKRALNVTLVQGAEAIETYLWDHRWIGFCRCKHCGCVTHHVATHEPQVLRGVNARMFVNFDPASVTIHRSDNAHTGFFWSRPDAPIWPGPQAPLPPPGPDDWR